MSLQAPGSNLATIRLMDVSGKIVEDRDMSVNTNQPYNLSLNNLQSLSDGIYILECTDASTRLSN